MLSFQAWQSASIHLLNFALTPFRHSWFNHLPCHQCLTEHSFQQKNAATSLLKQPWLCLTLVTWIQMGGWYRLVWVHITDGTGGIDCISQYYTYPCLDVVRQQPFNLLQVHLIWPHWILMLVWNNYPHGRCPGNLEPQASAVSSQSYLLSRITTQNTSWWIYNASVCFYAGQWYRQLSPHYWTSENVLEWISDQVETTKFDASTLSLVCCTMDGPTLCQMNQGQMIEVFGPQLGSHLHQSLMEHKTKYGKTESHRNDYSCNSYKSFFLCD